MDFFTRRAEEIILEALQKGDLDNLPGQGKPLDLKDDSHIPSELRIAHKILKNAGYVPPEIEMKNRISSTRDLLKYCTEEEEAYRRIQKLNLMITKMNMTRKVPVNLEENQMYYQKVAEKVSVKKK